MRRSSTPFEACENDAHLINLTPSAIISGCGGRFLFVNLALAGRGGSHLSFREVVRP
jgi:hypothetical protein